MAEEPRRPAAEDAELHDRARDTPQCHELERAPEGLCIGLTRVVGVVMDKSHGGEIDSVPLPPHGGIQHGARAGVERIHLCRADEEGHVLIAPRFRSFLQASIGHGGECLPCRVISGDK